MEFLAMTIIAIVDSLMAETAQALNGYEILRRTFSEPVGIALLKATDRFILLQDEFAVRAWALYALWALVFALPVSFLLRLLWGR